MTMMMAGQRGTDGSAHYKDGEESRAVALKRNRCDQDSDAETEGTECMVTEVEVADVKNRKRNVESGSYDAGDDLSLFDEDIEWSLDCDGKEGKKGKRGAKKPMVVGGGIRRRRIKCGETSIANDPAESDVAWQPSPSRYARRSRPKRKGQNAAEMKDGSNKCQEADESKTTEVQKVTEFDFEDERLSDDYDEAKLREEVQRGTGCDRSDGIWDSLYPQKQNATSLSGISDDKLWVKAVVTRDGEGSGREDIFPRLTLWRNSKVGDLALFVASKYGECVASVYIYFDGDDLPHDMTIGDESLDIDNGDQVDIRIRRHQIDKPRQDSDELPDAVDLNDGCILIL